MSTVPVQLSDLKREQAPRETRLPAVQPGFGDLASFELMQRAARLLSASPLVPAIYQGADGFPSCVIALNMALRMQADPLMVMQNLDVIHGRPSWRATFLIACFNQCGKFTAIRYRWQGTEGDDSWGCRAWAIEKASGEEIVGPLVTIALAKAEQWYGRTGSKWKTIPELMLTYRAAAWMIRTHAPEIAMGLPSTDESEDIVTLTREQYSVEQVKAQEHAAPKSEPQAPAGAEPTPTEPEREPDPEPAMTYAFVADLIAKVKSPEALDEASDLIRGIGDEQQRAELDVLARKRRKEITK